MRIDKIMFKNENRQLNFIDLFAGAGGLSEGFFQAGFNPIAHVEMNKSASKTLETRSAYYYLKKNNELDLYYQYERGQITRDELFSHIPDDVIKTVINAEMSPDTLPGIFEQIDTILKEDKVSDVDVIIGGPPCQAYSLVGRAQSSHMLTPMEEDPRNELYKMYTRFLTKYQPRMFVFENVAGLLTARGGDAFKNLTAHLKRVGYEIDFKEQNAADFRVLQKRKRIIIIGWRKGTDHFYPEFEKIRSNATVHDLLDDLAPVERGQENDAYRLTYDQCSAYLKENNIRTEEDVVTHHIARPNNDTIIPLNAAKSDILALQTIGRGLRLPFGEITHVEEIDTLDIVAHDHYREIIDDIKDNPVFKRRNLDDEDIPETEVAKVEAVVQDQQISIFDDMFKDANVKSFQEIDTNKDIDNLYEAYQKAYVKKAAPKKKDSKPDGQITIFDLFGSGDDTNSVDTGSKEEQAPTDTTVSQDNIDITIELNEPSKSNVPELYVKEIFKQKVEEFKKVAISVPKISISYSSSVEFKPFTVKRNVLDFDVAASKIERYDAVNNRLLQTLDADPLMVDDPENTLACSLLESIPEFSYDDADLILDVVEQYLRLIDGDDETKKRIIRRYATVIVEDLRQQIYASKELLI